MRAYPMEPTGQIKFVLKEVEQQLIAFRSRQRYNRNATFTFTIASSALSAGATVLIGISELYDTQKVLSVLAMVSTAIATVLSAWGGLFANRKMWVTAGTAVGNLEALDRDIRFAQSKGAVSDEETDVYYKRYCAIIQTAEESWRAAVQG
jgi:hypothetical protein